MVERNISVIEIGLNLKLVDISCIFLVLLLIHSMAYENFILFCDHFCLPKIKVWAKSEVKLNFIWVLRL